MTKRISRTVLLISLFVLLVHLVLDLQFILGDRYSFLDEVQVTVHYSDLSAQKKVKVWRLTLDNKLIELSDKRIDSVRKTIVYRNVPRSTFIRNLFVETDELAEQPVKTVSVNIGQKVTQYRWQDIKTSWQREKIADNRVRWVMPVSQIVPTSTLPSIRDIINWRGDWLLIKYILVRNINLILFTLLYSLFSLYADAVNKVRLSTKGGFLLLTITAFLKSTFHLWPLEGNIDPSFVAGLSWAFDTRLQWGTDIVFTYGPYFWLVFSSLIMSSGQLWLAFAGNVLLTTLSFYVLLQYVRKLYSAKRITYSTALILVLIVLLFHFDFLDYLVLTVLFLVYRQGTKEAVRLSIGGTHLCLQIIVVLLSLLSLIKFSYVAFSCSQLVFLSLIFGFKRRFWDIPVAWLSYFVWLIVLWWGAGQRTSNLWPYLTNGYEIASGYTEAMASPLWDNSSIALINLVGVFFLLVALFVVVLFLQPFAVLYRKTGIVLFALVASPMIFLAFKEGFVRFDPPHMALFYSQILLLTILAVLILSEQGVSIRSLPGRSFMAVITISCCLAPLARLDVNDALSLIISEKTKEATLRTQKAQLINEFDIAPAHSDLLRQATSADIIPVNIALLNALGSVWKPRPVIQSYSVYTPALSRINGQQYSGPQAPEYVLFSYYSIDNRYPVHDEPGVIAALLTNYTVAANQSNSYLILRRKAKPDQQQPAVRESRLCALNSPFPVKRIANKHTFMSANVELTSLGKLFALAYKVPPLSILIKSGKTVHKHRAIRRTLSEGVLVSAYCADVDDVEAVINRRTATDVSRIELVGNAWFYQTEVPVQFSIR